MSLAEPARGVVRRLDLGSPDDADRRVHPLGWIGDDLLLAVDDNGGTDAELWLFSLVDRSSRVVGTVDGGVSPSLTVAVDLVTPERPTVERPEPDWPWSDERRAVVIGLGVIGVLVLVCGARRLGRRRR